MEVLLTVLICRRVLLITRLNQTAQLIMAASEEAGVGSGGLRLWLLTALLERQLAVDALTSGDVVRSRLLLVDPILVLDLFGHDWADASVELTAGLLAG